MIKDVRIEKNKTFPLHVQNLYMIKVMSGVTKINGITL